MAKIFISYRREDSQHQADRLHAALARKIPKRNIFIDVDNIPVGVNFAQHLDQQVAQCDVLLALIGPDWLEVKNSQTGQRRLDDPKDFVRIEIAAALKRGIPVAPVLLDGTPVPPEHRLPEDLKGLTLRNGVEVRRLSFDADAERLLRGLNLGRPAAAKTTPNGPASAQRSTGARSAWIDPMLALGLLTVGGGAYAWFGNPGDWRSAALSPAADERTGDALEVSRRPDLIDTEFDERIAAADPSNGERVSYKCRQCHTFVEGGLPAIGPPLFGVVGRDIATVPDFDYSPALMAQEGIWTRAKLETWIRKPSDLAAGSRMMFAGIDGEPTSVQDRADLIAYLDTLKEVVEPPVGPSPGEVFHDCSDCPQMVSVPGGSFMMGSPTSESSRRSDEGPQRRVSASAFAAGTYEVTWTEYEACVTARACDAASDDGFGKGSRPVTNVSWSDAKQYVAWLSIRTGKAYRLLSEAEWEYAARAGNQARWSFGDSESSLGTYAWYISNSGLATHAVGTKAANAFGLYDMHGNVWEWVEDCYADSYSAVQTYDGRAFAQNNCSARVYRGGSWSNDPQVLRTALRVGNGPAYRFINLGFRVARTL